MILRTKFHCLENKLISTFDLQVVKTYDNSYNGQFSISADLCIQSRHLKIEKKEIDDINKTKAILKYALHFHCFKLDFRRI